MIELIQSINNFLSSPDIAFFFSSLLIKSLVILSISLMVVTLLKNNSPVIRSFVLSLTFLITIILPLLTFVLPSWNFTLPDIFPNGVSITTSSISPSNLQVTQPAIDNGLTVSMVSLFLAIWMIGSICFLTRITFGWLLVSRIIKRSKKSDNHDIILIIKRIQSKLGINQKVNIIFSDEISSPVAVGIWRSVIIFPIEAQEWDENNLEMSLTHELAHIKRHDVLWNFISSITTALYWINPLVWFCRKKLISEAEIVCDDYVLLSGSDAVTYANNLLNIAKEINKKYNSNLVGVNLAKKSELEERLMSIMSERKRKFSLKNSIFGFGIILTLAIVIPLSGMQLQAEESDDQKSSPIAQKKYENIPGPNDFVKVTTMPEQIKSIQPEYPKEAKKKNIEGDVWVKALIDKKGIVKDAIINKSSGNKLLDKSALKAAFKSVYKPAMLADKPVLVWVTYKVTFELNESDFPGQDEFVKVSTMPELTISIQPVYPDKLKKEKIEGEVWVNALVDKHGTVVKATIKKPSKHEEFDKSALKAAYGNKYKPAILDDKPVAVWVTYKVTFALTDKK